MSKTETITTPRGVQLKGLIYDDGSRSGWASPFREWSIQHLIYESRNGGCEARIQDYKIRPRYNLYHNSKFVADYATLDNALEGLDNRKTGW